MGIDTLLATKIATPDDARAFIAACVLTIGAGFHPETAGEEYVTPQGSRIFVGADALAFDAQIAACYALLPDPCEVALDALRGA